MELGRSLALPCMMETESLQIRSHGDASRPALIYLPGIHGDWTLVSSFRERMKSHVRFVEFTYPRTLDWSLDDYARAVLAALRANGIGEGVLLGESFGSQVGWALLALCAEGRHSCRPANNSQLAGDSACSLGDGNVALPFSVTTLILAGGFARYPFMPLVDFTRAVWAMTPAWLMRAFFRGYAVFARWRHRHAPETAGAIKEFVARRTPLDLAAMGHRLKLIRENEPVALARQMKIPVYQLAGFWDPIVFSPPVKRWLQSDCPGYRATQIISGADHNVLGTAPDVAAKQVLEWLYHVLPASGGRLDRLETDDRQNACPNPSARPGDRA